MNKPPDFECYYAYHDNYGLHALRFTDAAGNRFWFSYKSLVAFATPGMPPVVRQNMWGAITGKHLSAIDGGDKAGRWPFENFKKEYAATFNNEKDQTP